MKIFNTAGPVNRPFHYKIDPLHRWDLDDILRHIKLERYFILHAPRQTGKTSSLLALQEYLNNSGEYFALYANFEVGQAARNNALEGIRGIIREIKNRLPKDAPCYKKTLEVFNNLSVLTEFSSILNELIQTISEYSDKPVVLLVDEIDALVGDTLITVLRQLRAGYDKRPAEFPASIILCGVRDIKDYRIQTSGQDIIAGGSAFNIKTESLRLGNFSKEDVINLYSQHTEDTGQKFTEECFDLVMDYTDGQPWLVNALANEVTYKMEENRDRSVAITPKMLEIAKERLILSRQTHLDQLADKLEEERVKKVILPLITGDDIEHSKDDADYCMDLGLIKRVKAGLEISNGIYKEVIPRELTEVGQDMFLSKYRPVWINKDGSIDVKHLITLFKEFWNENSAIWASHIAGYQEAAPHLVTQAFLQRVANGNGFVNREYGLGKGRTDIMLKWQYEKDGQTFYQKIVMELKVINQKQSYEKLKQQALEQTAKYAKTCGTKEAHILIFDRHKSQNWQADEPNEYEDYDDIKIEIWKLGNGEW
jgi:hypothetical protein